MEIWMKCRIEMAVAAFPRPWEPNCSNRFAASAGSRRCSPGAPGLGDREPNPGFREGEAVGEEGAWNLVPSSGQDGYSISEPSEAGDMASDQEYKAKMDELKVAPIEPAANDAARGSEARCCAFSRSVV
ncbi:High-affinity Na(+)/H(+) antiporter NhaS3 [Durusdinium trenchii]|uniref:High-affinity Na(+)/H(+) antiporter NhaS3 n=1 Tax=Durusdinium trenchii TaxID=1381693 RepID=A0ABP0RFS2_9DINO